MLIQATRSKDELRTPVAGGLVLVQAEKTERRGTREPGPRLAASRDERSACRAVTRQVYTASREEREGRVRIRYA